MRTDSPFYSHCFDVLHESPLSADVFSYFDKNDCFDAQTLNHGPDGMCFKSRFGFGCADTLYIRVKEFHPHGPCTGACEGLRSATLAQVKWCEEIPDNCIPAYKVGVKYYAPIY